MAHPIDAGLVGAEQVTGADVDGVLERVVVRLTRWQDRLELALHRHALILGDAIVHDLLGDGHQRDATDGEGAEHEAGEHDGFGLHLARSLPCP